MWGIVSVKPLQSKAPGKTGGEGGKLTVAVVLLFCPIDGPICLKLQMEALSTVQLCDDPLQLGLYKGGRQREREEDREKERQTEREADRQREREGHKKERIRQVNIQSKEFHHTTPKSEEASKLHIANLGTLE